MAAKQPFAVSGKRMSLILCQPCEKDDKSTPASSFCINCAEYQCKECLKLHKRFADLKNHRIIDSSEVEENYFSPEISRCQVCRKEEYEYICKEHDITCCHECAKKYHKECIEDLIHLRQIELIGALELDKRRQEVTNNLEKVKTTADKMSTLKEKYTKETNKKIQEMQDKMNEMFENFKSTVSQRIASAFKSDKDYILELEEAIADIENISKETNPHQRIHDVDVLKTRIEILMEELDNNYADKQTIDVKLTFNDSVKLPPNINYKLGELTITNVKANDISYKLRKLNVEVTDTSNNTIENEVQGRNLDVEITDISDGAAESELGNPESSVNVEKTEIENGTNENENGNPESNVNVEDTDKVNGTHMNENGNPDSILNVENSDIVNDTNVKENGNTESNKTVESTEIENGTNENENGNPQSNTNVENTEIKNETNVNENRNPESNKNVEKTEIENCTNENKNGSLESKVNVENTDIVNGSKMNENGNPESNKNVENREIENGTKENENGNLESNVNVKNSEIVSGTNKNENKNPERENNLNVENTEIENGTNENENENPENNKIVENTDIVYGTNEKDIGDLESNLNVENMDIVNGTNENENGSPESNLNVENKHIVNGTDENENGNPESNLNVENKHIVNGTDENENGNPESNLNVEDMDIVNGTNENENTESNVNVEDTDIVNGTNEYKNGNPETNLNVDNTDIVNGTNENENGNAESNVNAENTKIENGTNVNENGNPESTLNVGNTEIVKGTHENGIGNPERNTNVVFADYPDDQIDSEHNHNDPVCNLQLLSSIDLNAVGNQEEPFYTGIDFMSDGRLVAVDNVNKKCTLFNQHLEAVNSYELSNNPQSVVAASENEVVITKGYEHKIEILFISETNEIAAMDNINVTKLYGSICMMAGDNFLVGSFDDLQPVRVVSVLGEENEIGIIFPAKKYTLGNFVCAYIQNWNKVALTDKFAHMVYIYDIANNTSVEVFERKFIRQPSGLAVGPNDCILVCCTPLNSIVQISHTGQILSSHVLDIWYPQCICVSKDNTKIAVSNGAVGVKKLQLYSIHN